MNAATPRPVWPITNKPAAVPRSQDELRALMSASAKATKRAYRAHMIPEVADPRPISDQLIRRICQAIYHHGEANRTQINKHTAKKSETIGRALREMVSGGLINCATKGTNAKYYTLTEKGMDFWRKAND